MATIEITVGTYPYLTLDSALEHVEELSPWEPITQGVGGITTTKNTDRIIVSGSGASFLQARAGDFIEIVGAHKNSSDPGGIYDAMKPYLGQINNANTEARLVSGVNKNVTNAVWSLYRPNTVTIYLPSGRHTLTANTSWTIPNGTNLSIVGAPGAIIEGSGSSQFIRYRQFSSVSIQNIVFEDVFDFISPYMTAEEAANGYKPDGIISLANVTVNNPIGARLMELQGSRIYINNITGNNGNLGGIQGDDVIIANCFLRTSGEDYAFGVSQPDAGWTTKSVTISNCNLEITNDAGCLLLGAGGGGLSFLKEYQITNCYIKAAQTQGNLFALNLQYGKYVITNCIIDGPITLGAYPSIVTMINTRQSDGAPVVIPSSSGYLSII